MKQKKYGAIGKLVSLLLVLVMVMGIFPIQAFAEDEDCIVAFDPADGTGYNDFYKVTVAAGSTVTDQPEDPTRNGYFFQGWYAYLDENHSPVFWNFETDTVTENMTLWAAWAAWEKGCIVAFDPADGTGYNDFYKVTVAAGSTITDRPADPTRDGFLFKGWYAYLDGNGSPVFWNFETDTITENTTLWAAWAAWEKSYIVVFDPADGTEYNDFYKVTVAAGSTITDRPADPTRDGFLFKGWYAYLDGNDGPVFWNFATDAVTENTTLWAAWAAWEKSYIVAFDPADGTEYNDFYKVTVAAGNTITDRPADPTRDGFLFKGWYAYLDGNDSPVLWNFATDTVTENTTLWAAWAAWEKSYIVVFDPADGTEYNDFYKVTVAAGSTITDRPADPTRDGFLFKGWYAYLDGNDSPVLWNFATDTVTENTTLWAAWEKSYIVVFDPADGTEYNDFYKVTVAAGNTITDRPADPTRDGFLFKGWYAYLDGNDSPVLWNFATDTVTENTTLWAAWAAWEKSYIVVFDPADGTEYNDFYKVTVAAGSTITDQPADPTRDGFLFKGWYAYLDGNDSPVFWNFETDTVTENTTLWAAWEPEGESGSGGNTKPGGGTDTSGRDKSDRKATTVEMIEIVEDKIPLSSNELDELPNTGGDSLRSFWLWSGLVSLLGITMLFTAGKRKAAQ
ncbi:InlB B-repeat-containing protein [Oscillospiraceae bacterium MB08-C2-2]|nr:InlB B-repeat-containing protein [Oscillospiraceae bacterium MB08-C2-2]